MLAKATHFLGVLNSWIRGFCSVVVSGLLVLIVVILFGSVFWRYFLNDPISWSEDAALFCMVWMTLLGAPVGLMRGEHVAVDMLLNMLPGGFARTLLVAINGVILTTAVTVVYYGGPFVRQGMARIIPSMDWLSQGYVYLALPVGFGLLVPVCAENILKAVRFARSGPVELG